MDDETNRMAMLPEVLRSIPIYQDLLQPATKQLGQAADDVAYVARQPLAAMRWTVDQIKQHLQERIPALLADTPPERRTLPNARIVRGVLDGLHLDGPKEQLRDMYTRLLATATDAQTAEFAHPSFTEILAQMTPDEARIMRTISGEKYTLWGPVVLEVREVFSSGGETPVLRNFSLVGFEANCEYPLHTPLYLQNLCRLSLIEIPFPWHGSSANYEPLMKHPEVVRVVTEIGSRANTPKYDKQMVLITPLGRQFIQACINP